MFVLGAVVLMLITGQGASAAGDKLAQLDRKAREQKLAMALADQAPNSGLSASFISGQTWVQSSPTTATIVARGSYVTSASCPNGKEMSACFCRSVSTSIVIQEVVPQGLSFVNNVATNKATGCTCWARNVDAIAVTTIVQTQILCQ